MNIGLLNGLRDAARSGQPGELDPLGRHIQDLPEAQRSAILLREFCGLSYEEISVVMDRPIPSVKSLLVRARVSLTLKYLASE
jgi:DNA-directed RNA polymerase specialized sigma24 family protein